MSRSDLNTLTVEQLVERFAAVGLEQDQAILEDNNDEYAHLFWQMEEIKKELKRRSGDQRRALLGLYSHPNIQVRLKAAKATLAVAPEQARRMIEEIAQSKLYPHAGDAGMCLWMLDRGDFVPD
jgi:Domain of unknown function (DUF2019)